MLAEYQAACTLESNSECQLGIADAHAKLGHKERARSAYQALVDDPFAQDAAVAKAKAGLARLEAALASAPELPLDATAKESGVAAASSVPPLDIPPPAARPADLPPLDLPPALPDASASKTKSPKRGETK